MQIFILQTVERNTKRKRRPVRKVDGTSQISFVNLTRNPHNGLPELGWVSHSVTLVLSYNNTNFKQYRNFK
jgi:hypothetical protein